MFCSEYYFDMTIEFTFAKSTIFPQRRLRMTKRILSKIFIIYMGTLFFLCSISWASDKSSTSKNVQLPAPKVSPSEILDSDYLQGQNLKIVF
jgi:hypothetical protein